MQQRVGVDGVKTGLTGRGPLDNTRGVACFIKGDGGVKVNILSIGNSFSQDAQKYLHEIAASGGVQLHAENLYIGGCPLQVHAEDLRSDEAAYDDEINGKRVGTISLPEALRLRTWDVVTLQRSSGMSGEYDSYQPYLNELVAAVRTACPGARLFIHQTWAYEDGADHPDLARYGRDRKRMFAQLTAAYRQAAADIDAESIPVGTVIEWLRDRAPGFIVREGGKILCRDGYHLSFDLGRYAAGSTWYRVLCGRSPRTITFVPPVAPGTDAARIAGLLPQIAEAVAAVTGL